MVAVLLFCLFHSALSAEEDLVIESVVGDSAELPCEVNASDVSLVLWYRGGEAGRPVYSVDAREGPLMSASHFPGQALATRARYDASASVLRISSVMAEDAGRYRCRVEYRRARTDTQDSFLNVIVPPHDVIIMDEFGQRLHGIIGPYNEGAPLTLICEGDGGSPPPAVTWWREGQLIDDSFQLTPQEFSRNELTIPTLNRSDLMSVLTCQASNTNLTSPVSSSVSLDLNLRPLEVQITTLYRPLSAGQPAELVCLARGGRPPAQVTWWWLDNAGHRTRESGRVSESAVKEDNLTISVLTLVPRPADHGRNLSCRADSPHVRDSEIEDVWQLDVYYQPKVRVRMETPVSRESGGELREGAEVIMACEVRANPSPERVSWLFNGTSLFLAPSSGLALDGPRLFIRPLQRDHRGTYQCTASNSEGRAESSKLLLKVQYAPRCHEVSPIRLGVSPGQQVPLACQVEAHPDDVTFRWEVNATGVELRAGANSTEPLRAGATLIPGEKPSSGEVRCWARNVVGPQLEPCVYRLFLTGPPGPPKNCLVTNASSDMLVIQCEAGNDGGLPTTYRAELAGPDSAHQANLSSREAPVFVLCGLRPDTAYVVLVAALNAKGRSPVVAVPARTDPSPDLAKTDYELLSYFLGIIIGAIAVLFITMIGVFAATKYKQKKKRKGKMLQKEEEKAQAHLIKECSKGPRITDSQGPDIIPDKSYFQEKGDPRLQGRADSNGFDKYQDVPLQFIYHKSRRPSFKDDPTALESPRKTEFEGDDITVETPLINDLQQKAPSRVDKAPSPFNESAILSTSV